MPPPNASIQRPVLTVLHGQPGKYSTTFQTKRLAAALARWFEPEFVEVPDSKSGLRRTLNRVTVNYLRPLFVRPRSDYLLYCNDGAADLRHWRGVRTVYWYDAPRDWSKQPPRRTQWIQWLRYRNILEADRIFAVSAAQVAVARALRKGREDSVEYLPVGVDCQVFDPARADANRIRDEFKLPAKTIIGYLGYLGIYQNRFAGEMLLDAARDVLKLHDVHFLIVGFGPAMGAWTARVQALGLERQFTFTGFVADAWVPHCIAAMDICIDTLEEGFHSEARSETKLKQYMAMGRACVATAIGENRVDLDNGNCGKLARPGAEGLFESVCSLVGDAELRKKLGEAARARAVAVYDWPVLAEKMAAGILSVPPQPS